MKVQKRLIKREPDGWDSARLWGLVLNFGRFPVSGPFSPQGSNTNR